ncbi:MAG: ATP-dependent zinc metalloprotease FtsH [Paludibacteraceae bacterium]|nr:ATP-dependent zinc metalloprotease FtsH [Paludibacteraceae bacterium]
MEKEKESKQKASGKNGKKGFRPNLNWLFLLIFVVLIVMNYMEDGEKQRQIPYSQFEQLVARDVLLNVTINTDANTAKAEIKPDSVTKVLGKNAVEKGQKAFVQVNVPSVEQSSKMLAERQFKGEIKYAKDDGLFSKFLFAFGPIVLFIALWVFLLRRMSGGIGGGGVFSVGKSKAQVFDKDNKVNVTFKDVAGLAGAKQEIEEIVEFLKNPKKYTDLGGKIPKGALLVGPPGTGKTLLAKAVAGEAGVPFFSMSGSDFVEMFVGVGASRVRDLFKQAKEKSPCIIFIDEIDAVGRARGKNPSMSSNDERENTLNQLLTEMDGFGSNSGVIILAATNRADILDKALLRAGRFDRQIHVDLPDLNERKEIFQVHLRPLKTSKELDVDFLAKQTPGFSGADIANVCNEAALTAARKNKNEVENQDFMDAVDRIVGGLEKKTKIMTAAEKKAIAYHEAGHATISWLLEHANPLVKVTIVPRGMALGAAWYLPEERVLTNREHILDEMCSTLGGRAAEELFSNTASTGAVNDLERVTKVAYAMVTYYGMSENIPNMSYYDSNDYGFTKPYSEETAEKIDKEAQRIISEQYERAKRILAEHEEGHHKIAQLLIDKEVIYADDVKEILGERPWESRADELLADEKASAEQREKDAASAAEKQEAEVKAAPADEAETVAENVNEEEQNEIHND